MSDLTSFEISRLTIQNTLSEVVENPPNTNLRARASAQMLCCCPSKVMLPVQWANYNNIGIRPKKRANWRRMIIIVIIIIFCSFFVSFRARSEVTREIAIQIKRRLKLTSTIHLIPSLDSSSSSLIYSIFFFFIRRFWSNFSVSLEFVVSLDSRFNLLLLFDSQRPFRNQQVKSSTTFQNNGTRYKL